MQKTSTYLIFLHGTIRSLHGPQRRGALPRCLTGGGFIIRKKCVYYRNESGRGRRSFSVRWSIAWRAICQSSRSFKRTRQGASAWHQRDRLPEYARPGSRPHPCSHAACVESGPPLAALFEDSPPLEALSPLELLALDSFLSLLASEDFPWPLPRL